MAFKALDKPLSRYGGLLTKTLIVMKLSVMLILIFSLHAGAKTVGQTVTLNMTNQPIEKFFDEIKRQTGYTFIYDDELLERVKTVSIVVKDATIPQALDQCFLGKSITYQIANKLISIKVNRIAAADRRISEAPPSSDIEGVVFDENGDPLPGATVKIEGGKVVAITDLKGNFRIKETKTLSAIIISYTGYTPVRLEIGNQLSYRVSLTRSPDKLDEMHVIAYGTSTQRFSVGSISKISSEEIVNQPIGNPLDALAGRVPGLTVSETSGVPGAAVKIQIRGQNNINPNLANSAAPIDNPLIIIDGVPTAAQNGGLNLLSSLVAPPSGSSLLNDPYSGISPLNSINPADIESIEILRDADATAIYGSRGSNGVIIITTKGGKKGKTELSTRFWNGWSSATRTMPMMNTGQYLQMRREAFSNDQIIPNATPSSPGYAPDLFIFDTTKYTDWNKYFLGGTAHVLDANVSLSGGSSITQFSFGSGYHHQTYITPGNFSDDRVSFSSDIRHSSSDNKFKFEFSALYSYDENNSSGSPGALTAFTLPPNYPNLLDGNGNLNWYYKGINLNLNPMSYLQQLYLSQVYNLLAHAQISYQLLPGLTFRSSFGYNTTSVRENSQTPQKSLNPALNQNSSSNFARNDLQTWIIEPQAEYLKYFGRNKIDILIGGTIQQNANFASTINGSNYPSDGLLGSPSAAGTTVVGSANSQYKYAAMFGRINYVWNSQIILNISGRRDGSSRFGPGKQFGDFGSLGAGWIFSESPFVKSHLPFVSFGKIRGSYGTTGSDAIGDYKYLSTWGPASFPYQGVRGYVPQNLFNPNFSWALTKKEELGLELGILKDRISLNATWFRNRSGNQLTQYALPIQTGFSQVTENFPALVENTGWEFQFSSNNIRTKRVNWSTSLNFTIPRNRLIAFPGISTSSYSATYIVGQSLSVINRFRSLGINDTTGVYEFTTSKGAPTYYPVPLSDNQVIGNLDPKWYGGIRNTISFDRVRLDFLFEFRKQLGTSLLFILTSNPPGGMANLPAYYLSRWTQPGDKSAFEKLTTNFGSDAYNSLANAQYSDLAYTDASYLRLKNLSVSYDCSGKVLSKYGISNLRFYIIAQNLITVTSYKGIDPENQVLFGIPPLKTVACGIQINL